jgi:hypothetical protein
MDFKTNFGNLAENIGYYMGIAEGADQKSYVSGLMESAHDKTVPAFVKESAAVAKSKNFAHMYEYSVRGINRGDGSLINPTSQRARLWKDVLLGSGTRRTISFMYRDAVQRVPKHTTAETGVAQEELDKLKLNQGKRYVFAHKAEVFEEGIDVNIHPKQQGGMLFVPLLGGARLGRVSERDQARGFTWAKKLHIVPGEMSGATGQFSAHFFKWWSSEGNVLMVNHMEKTVTKHVKEVEAKVGLNRGSLRGPKSSSITSATERSAAKVRKQFTIWAREEANSKQVVI